MRLFLLVLNFLNFRIKLPFLVFFGHLKFNKLHLWTAKVFKFQSASNISLTKIPIPIELKCIKLFYVFNTNWWILWFLNKKYSKISLKGNFNLATSDDVGIQLNLKYYNWVTLIFVRDKRFHSWTRWNGTIFDRDPKVKLKK